MGAESKEKKSSARAQATKNHIAMSYLLLMRHHQWDRISVKDLCEKAAVTRGTFYQYYSSIMDLMETIENDTLRDIQNIMTQTMQKFRPANVLFTSDFDRDYSITPSHFTIAWFQYCMNNKEKMRSLLNREFSDNLFISRVEQILSRYASSIMKGDGLPDDKYRRHYVKLYVSSYIVGFLSWAADEEADKTPPEDMALIVDSMRTGGLYTARRTRMEEYGK